MLREANDNCYVPARQCKLPKSRMQYPGQAGGERIQGIRTLMRDDIRTRSALRENATHPDSSCVLCKGVAVALADTDFVASRQ